jgi:NitT/TauT family transport system substrate-binding protein
VVALSAGWPKATITSHIAVQPYTERGLKIPGAHVLADSRQVFGGPLTQITLIATKRTKEKNPTLFKAVANALNASIKLASADKKTAAVLWKTAQKASESVDELVHLLDDPGFEFTTQPHRIAYFAAFLNRIGTMKTKLGDWKDLFWETAYNETGD